jgi:hypothetical protein
MKALSTVASSSTSRRIVGLRTAVNAYLLSASFGATTFGGYKGWISDNRSEHLTVLEAPQRTWGL